MTEKTIEPQAVARPENEIQDLDLAKKLDGYSLEQIVETKISRFLDMIGTNYPSDFHSMIMSKAEKPLMSEVLKRNKDNQVHTARILGINRNTLRKKMRGYDLMNNG